MKEYEPRDAWSIRVHNYWLRRVPETVARSQAAYERRALAKRMRDAGFTLQQVANRFVITRERARQMLLTHETKKHWRSPIQKYFDEPFNL